MVPQGKLVRAHTGGKLLQYRTDPMKYMEERLGIPRKTIQWSLLPEYKKHRWDGDPDPLKAILDAIVDGYWVAVESAKGVGKAQPLDSIVLTTRGWIKFRDLTLGDLVYGSDGRPHALRGIFNRGIRNTLRISFSDGSQTVTCDEHIWTIKDKSWRQHRNVTARELHNHIGASIPTVKAVQHTERSFSIDPYVLGCLLGDATMRAGGLRITSADAEIVDEIKKRLGQSFDLRHIKNTTNKYDYAIVDLKRPGGRNRLRGDLNLLGFDRCYSHDKFIPEQYKFGSIHQRLELLQGLMDTDGTVTKNNASTFTSTSQRLAQDVEYIVRSLGGHARTKKRPRSYTKSGSGERFNARDAYTVVVILEVCPFRLTRKAARWRGHTYLLRRIVKVEDAGKQEVACISVESDDRLYVTNDFILTHNTYLGAAILLWFLECFKNSIVNTTAPKQDQLSQHIWKEVGILFPKFGRGELMQTMKLRMIPGDERWAASAFVAGVSAKEASAAVSATKAHGAHAEHMLFIVEETPGVHDSVLAAIEETCGAPHNLVVAFGNPNNIQDTLHQFSKRKRVKLIRISALDHPNIVMNNPDFIPGAQSRVGLNVLLNKYGSEEHPMYQSRGRGICPEQAVDSLIRYDWCVAAANRAKEMKKPGPVAMGVDVANSEAGDKAAKARGDGSELLIVDDFQCPNANKLGEQVYLDMQMYHIAPENVGVDGVGVGAGTINKLEELGVKVQNLMGGAKQEEQSIHHFGDENNELRMAEKFANLRTQMYYQLRIDLQFGDESGIILPNDPELFADLCAIKMLAHPKHILVESKPDIKKRLGRSTNKGDSAVYWNWVRMRHSGIGGAAMSDSGDESTAAGRSSDPFKADRKRTW